ncbi:MAG: hypothetical protein LBB36_06430 [Fibromonadaceae bacterium]|jgi:uncharacterized protein (TIGR02145 family)|nr:hypothetical protein [Fibromonadaceae bacterium]
MKTTACTTTNCLNLDSLDLRISMIMRKYMRNPINLLNKYNCTLGKETICRRFYSIAVIMLIMVLTIIACGSDDEGGGTCDGIGGTLTYQNQTYRTVQIGSQNWMAENLNYNANGSMCGNGFSLTSANTATCDTYGRLYDWNTAIAVCPDGWHLPNDAEWATLTKFVGDKSAHKLKATSGWDSYGGSNGTDVCGFAALPGGYGIGDQFYGFTFDLGLWWSATASNSDSAAFRSITNVYDLMSGARGDKTDLLSVRCLQN